MTNIFWLQMTRNVPSPTPSSLTRGGWLSTECLTQPLTVIRQAVALPAPNTRMGGTSSDLITDMPPSPPHLLQKRTDSWT